MTLGIISYLKNYFSNEEKLKRLDAQITKEQNKLLLQKRIANIETRKLSMKTELEQAKSGYFKAKGIKQKAQDSRKSNNFLGNLTR